MTFEELPLDELRKLLHETSWQRLFVEIARCEPIGEVSSAVVSRFLAHHGVTPGWLGGAVFEPARLTVLARPAVERYIAVLFQRELAYGCERLPRPLALRYLGLLFIGDED